MSGALQATLLGNNGRIWLTPGSYTLTAKINLYYYGYDASSSLANSNFGALIASPGFKGANILGVYSYGVSSGQAANYNVVLSGNRAAGFFNSLTINTTLITGTLGAPSYNSTYDETTFTITVTAGASLLVNQGSNIPITLS